MKQGYENARDEYDIEEEVQDRSAFILNEDHAIDILERNAVKVGKNSPYLESLEVFDAVITLLALEYILKNAPYLRG